MNTLRALIPYWQPWRLSRCLLRRITAGERYDMKTRLTLKGTVSQVKWQNPHVLIYMDVKDEANNVGDVGV